ncbi:MAG TPA: hypothetical protein VMC07_02950, partial [Candidatus Omnitrophota bacterium]|nr:hypothetical protein [Candidatus Omnitrophota bacterium]
EQYLPYSFLYSLTSSSDFLQKLVSEQITVNGQSYWDAGSVSGAYYDTAVALLSLQSQSPPEKTKATDWLDSTQGADGCWNSDNIADTAFILYSVSGSTAVSSSSSSNCLSSGYYCLSSSSCLQSNGNVLQGYICSSDAYICCSQPLATPKCSDEGGIICSSSSGQVCQGGMQATASDTSSGQICCIGGSCAESQQTLSDCELAGATCRSSCLSSEQTLAQNCDSTTEVCCSPKPAGSGIGWIIFFSALVLLVILGIIFRKQLRIWWIKIKSKSGKGGAQTTSRPSFPPSGPPMSFRRPPMPPPNQFPSRTQKSSEVNNVLSRLKEMGK